MIDPKRIAKLITEDPDIFCESDRDLQKIIRDARLGDPETVERAVREAIRNGYSLTDLASDESAIKRIIDNLIKLAKHEAKEDSIIQPEKIDQLAKEIEKSNGEFVGQEWNRELRQYARRGMADSGIASILTLVGDLTRPMDLRQKMDHVDHALEMLGGLKGMDLSEAIMRFVIGISPSGRRPKGWEF